MLPTSNGGCREFIKGGGEEIRKYPDEDRSGRERPGEIEGGGGLKVTYAHGTAPVVLRIPTEGGVVTEFRPIFHPARFSIHKRTASRPLSDFSGLGRLDD